MKDNCVWETICAVTNDKEFLEFILLKETKKVVHLIENDRENNWGNYFAQELSNPKISLNTHLERTQCRPLRETIFKTKSPEIVLILRMARIKI